MTVRAMRSAAQRILGLRAEVKELETELGVLARQIAPSLPSLLGLIGIGPVTAAQILVSWSHPGRFRSEAVFAGASPSPLRQG